MLGREEGRWPEACWDSGSGSGASSEGVEDGFPVPVGSEVPQAQAHSGEEHPADLIKSSFQRRIPTSRAGRPTAIP
jgi:hypothetical protein